MSAGVPLPRAFYERPATDVAPDLIGKLLVHESGTRTAGRIVEVEAYCGVGDPAAHSRRGPTARNASMFGPPGHLYVYLIYGLHWCANAVCAPAGVGDAVLLRALEPTHGVRHMAVRRRVADCRSLCSGPAKLTQALGIGGEHDGCDLTSPSGLSICDDGVVPSDVARSARIGISSGTDLLWRWYDASSAHLSRR
ncbi:DNA-3-methyladenine glycosylase [Candidatus Poriferisodalis sp.]|uniref:DNA-3-methyladenine glycosylase n=1 Tax=Candidatus Poriferisodalis sp. TaxID=3101277 RepID=UPI003B02302B